MRTCTLKELARLVAGTVHGDELCTVSNVAPLDKAQAGQLSFLSHERYRPMLATTQATAVLMKDLDERCSRPVLQVQNPRLALAQVVRYLDGTPPAAHYIHPTAVIGPECQLSHDITLGAHVVLGQGVKIAAGTRIGPGCVLGDNVDIAEDCTLHANVTLYDGVSLGARSMLHSGVVLGSDGFGFAQDGGRWVKMPHQGGVVVGCDVEIGANTCVDRGVFGDTEISDGVIIDNLVQIAHNVSIGQGSAIAGCVAIAGSTVIGQHCMIGGGSSISGHLTLADGVMITGTSAVNRSLSQAGSYSSGFPAKESRLWRRNVARFHHLDEMARRLHLLEKRLLEQDDT